MAEVKKRQQQTALCTAVMLVLGACMNFTFPFLFSHCTGKSFSCIDGSGELRGLKWPPHCCNHNMMMALDANEAAGLFEFICLDLQKVRERAKQQKQNDQILNGTLLLTQSKTKITVLNCTFMGQQDRQTDSPSR